MSLPLSRQLCQPDQHGTFRHDHPQKGGPLSESRVSTRSIPERDGGRSQRFSGGLLMSEISHIMFSTVRYETCIASFKTIASEENTTTKRHEKGSLARRLKGRSSS